MGFIYLVTNEVNNKKYVGQTTAPKVETRWRQHKYGGVGPCLLKAYRKHGYNSFRYEVLCECPNEDCNSLEIQYIKKLDTIAPKGYNLQGGGLNFSVHPDTRRKISESKIGKSRPVAQCIYCSKQAQKTNIIRWHNETCKFKK